MTITQLEYLLAVVNHGNFSTGAEHCFATQSALSKQICLLEEELGVILLDRSSRPIVPTESGKIFLESARETMRMFYETKGKINDLRGQLSGKIIIGAIPTISPYLIPKFITRFAKQCPNVKFEIMDMYTTDIVDSLNRDVIDIGILSGGESAVKIRETVLFDDKLYMYVSRNNELYGRKSIVVNDIDIRKLLILSKGNCLRNQTLRLCKERKNIELQYDFTRCSLETLMHMADETGGMTIIPGMSIGYIPKERHDQIIPFGNKGACRKIAMAVGRTYVRDATVNAVRKYIMEVRQELQTAEHLMTR